MQDVIGKVIIELRDDEAVSDIVDDRVRGTEPAPGDADKPYKAFVVVSMLAPNRYRRVPIQRPAVSVRCYGKTPIQAAQLYGACSDAVHGRGPRVHGEIGIYLSEDAIGGGSPGKDPDTKQPYIDFTIDLFATTQAVA